MDFWDNTLSILAGVVLGFGLSIVAFPVQNWLRERSFRKSLATNVKREFDFNESFLQEKIDDLQSTIDAVSAGSRSVFYYFNYSSFMRLFLLRYFDQGYLFEKLKDHDDIKMLNSILSVMTPAVENYVNNTIQMWKNQAMTKDQAVEVLNYQRDQLRRFQKGLRRIKKAIVPK